MGFHIKIFRLAIIQIVLVGFYLFSKRIQRQIFKINIFNTFSALENNRILFSGT